MNKRRLTTPPSMLARSTGLLLLALALALVPMARAQPPQYMSYQGYLTDGNGNALGSTNTGPKAYDVVFRIWDLPNGGTIGGADDLFAELQTVTVDNGYFSVLLGQGTSYQAEPHSQLSSVFTTLNAPRYVEMTVLGIGSGGASVTILPRLQLVDAPYALLAINAVNITGTNVITAANLSTNLGLWQANGPNIYYPSGNVGIGVPNPAGPLAFPSTLGDQISLYGNFGSANFGFGIAPSTLQIHAPNSSSDVAFGWGNSATMTETMRIKGNGNVGIGTSSPSAPLHIASSGFPTAIINSSSTVGTWLDLQNTGGGTNWDIVSTGSGNGGGPGNLLFESAFAPNGTSDDVLTLTPGGNVGIGTLTPAAALDLNGNFAMGNGQWLEARNNTNGLEPVFWPRWSDNVTYLNYGSGGFNIRNDASSSAIFIQADGNVGIGTLTPSKGQLEIDTANGNEPGYSKVGVLNTNGAGTLSLGPSGGVSIWAAGWVLGSTFDAFSDERIKNIKGQSDGAADLKTLLGIKVTDFTYKDTIAKGNRPQKKVIAQQVEQVYPQAVNMTTSEVPDIFKPAAMKDGWIQLATDLKVGERVKLMGEKEHGIYPVLEVRADAFRTDFKSATEKVFVYGREVKDFRTVDYDAIAMLNVSATQELARRVEELEKRESHVAELEQKGARVQALEREVAELKNMVTQLAQSAKAGHARGQTASWTGSKQETRDEPTRVALGQ